MENRQGEGKNSVGNVEAKELISMTYKHCFLNKSYETANDLQTKIKGKKVIGTIVNAKQNPLIQLYRKKNNEKNLLKALEIEIFLTF